MELIEHRRERGSIGPSCDHRRPQNGLHVLAVLEKVREGDVDGCPVLDGILGAAGDDGPVRRGHGLVHLADLVLLQRVRQVNVQHELEADAVVAAGSGEH